MNKDEYWNCYKERKYYRRIQKLLIDWKITNNIPADVRYAVHHRDDTEETRKYNTEHYERWGFNEDDTFEYGKYVLFMTVAEHSYYHNIGKSLSAETREKISASSKGKILSDECKAKISASSKGKILSDECKAKLSAAHKGKILSDEHRAKLRENNARYWQGKHRAPFSDECKAKMSAARKRNLIGLRLLYSVYKNNDGAKKWNDFQKAIYNGDITFEERPISVFL